MIGLKKTGGFLAIYYKKNVKGLVQLIHFNMVWAINARIDLEMFNTNPL